MNSKRPLVWIALLCLAPFIASFVFYFWFPPSARINYGTLLPPRALPSIALQTPSGDAVAGTPLRGRWTLLTVDSAACAEICAKKLYATRQARTMQGKERERVARLWLVSGDGLPPAEVQAAHPDLTIARANAALLDALPTPVDGIFLVDPLGNLVLRYPSDPDIKRVYQDIARLLYASQIG